MTMTRKTTRSPRATHGTHGPFGGAIGLLAGAGYVRETLAHDPTRPFREAVDLLEKSRRSFKSGDVAKARGILDAFMRSVLPPIERPAVPDYLLTVRLDEHLGSALRERGDVSGTGSSGI